MQMNYQMVIPPFNAPRAYLMVASVDEDGRRVDQHDGEEDEEDLSSILASVRNVPIENINVFLIGVTMQMATGMPHADVNIFSKKLNVWYYAST